jgi:short subunit dehydrogenase-like uncharacterized protein
MTWWPIWNRPSDKEFSNLTISYLPLMEDIILYGANGYTGKLIARMAGEYNIKPVLAGRREEAVRPLAEQMGLEWAVADLNDPASLDALLAKAKLVLHAAGPFKYTARPMIEACIRNGKHYTDITGEILVYEMAKKYHEQALAKNIMLMPGVGFDVVPTDCMALHLKNKMADALNLKLAFASLGSGLSHGTATTMAEGMGQKSAERIDGKIRPVPLGQKGMTVDFGAKKLFVMSIPWGDISTAYTTTGIPNIVTYTAQSPRLFKMLKYQWAYNWLLRTSFMRNRQLKKIRSKPAGPSDEQRAKSVSLVWGEVTNAKGDSIQGRLKTPEGYTLTAITSLIITRKILDGQFKAGYQTPAGCYGEGLILEVPGAEFI